MDRLCPVGQSSEAAGAQWTLGDLLRLFLPALLPTLKLGARNLRLLRLLAACGTPELGANILHCPHCQRRHWTPRSCGDRHCPRCLAAKSRHWLQQQTQSLLPVTYYHCVFTLPSQLHRLVRANPQLLYPWFFESAAQSLLELGRNRLGGDLGLTAVLHTWGQKLNFHPHLHCIVTGGALSADGKNWRSPKQSKFLFPVRALGALFRGKFLAGVARMLNQNKLKLPDPVLIQPQERRHWFSCLYDQRWNVFVKRPFGGPQQVLSYLANYTHRVALSNRRLRTVDPERQTVTFTYRDYQHGSSVKELTLPALEFIRRFAWHLLPQGLVRIRHYGILGNNRRKRDVSTVRAILQRRPLAAQRQLLPTYPAPEPMPCPGCGKTGLRWLGWIDARGITHLNRLAKAAFDSS